VGILCALHWRNRTGYVAVSSSDSFRAPRRNTLGSNPKLGKGRESVDRIILRQVRDRAAVAAFAAVGYFEKPLNYTDFMKLLPVVNAPPEQAQITRLQAFLRRITPLVGGD
jgi:hypothetical protein